MKVKILVIDDDWHILTEMQKLFSKKGFESKIAIDSKEAKELICNEYFDIVYTDMKMPGLDGVGVCKIVKHLSPDTVVVVFSGSPHAMADRQAEFIENGGIDMFLRKPLTREEILKATYELLKKRRKVKFFHG